MRLTRARAMLKINQQWIHTRKNCQCTTTANYVCTIVELIVVRVFYSTLLATLMGEQGSKLENIFDSSELILYSQTWNSITSIVIILYSSITSEFFGLSKETHFAALTFSSYIHQCKCSQCKKSRFILELALVQRETVWKQHWTHYLQLKY